MAEKKEPNPNKKRRPVSSARLFKSLQEFMNDNGWVEDTPIGIVLDSLRDEIVKEATS